MHTRARARHQVIDLLADEEVAEKEEEEEEQEEEEEENGRTQRSDAAAADTRQAARRLRGASCGVLRVRGLPRASWQVEQLQLQAGKELHADANSDAARKEREDGMWVFPVRPSPSSLETSSASANVDEGRSGGKGLSRAQLLQGPVLLVSQRFAGTGPNFADCYFLRVPKEEGKKHSPKWHRFCVISPVVVSALSSLSSRAVAAVSAVALVRMHVCAYM
jgi:hypothetical protein